MQKAVKLQKPTNAFIGEGGALNTYNGGKMDEAMQRYGSGMRGISVIPDSPMSALTTTAALLIWAAQAI